MPIHGRACTHAALSFVRRRQKGHEQSPPSSRGGLGAPFACAGLQSREGGIGLDSRSCSCSPPGCLSPCPVSALAHIKHHCSQPRDCRGSAGQHPASRHREPRVFRLTPTQAQMQTVNAREGLQREPLTPGCPSGSSWGPLRRVGMDGRPRWV